MSRSEQEIGCPKPVLPRELPAGGSVKRYQGVLDEGHEGEGVIMHELPAKGEANPRPGVLSMQNDNQGLSFTRGLARHIVIRPLRVIDNSIEIDVFRDSLVTILPGEQ